MNPIPKIGRPNKSGLSVKELGVREYQRQMQARYRRCCGKPERKFSGLSLKILGWKDYLFAYRFLNKHEEYTT